MGGVAHDATRIVCEGDEPTHLVSVIPPTAAPVTLVPFVGVELRSVHRLYVFPQRAWVGVALGAAGRLTGVRFLSDRHTTVTSDMSAGDKATTSTAGSWSHGQLAVLRTSTSTATRNVLNGDSIVGDEQGVRGNAVGGRTGATQLVTPDQRWELHWGNAEGSTGEMLGIAREQRLW